MIESVYKKLHPATGIIYILVNTVEKWINYQVMQVGEPSRISITFYKWEDVETQPGQYEEYSDDIIEYIDVMEGFDASNYTIYHQQYKDQITLMLVPKEMMLNKQDWKELC